MRHPLQSITVKVATCPDSSVFWPASLRFNVSVAPPAVLSEIRSYEWNALQAIVYSPASRGGTLLATSWASILRMLEDWVNSLSPRLIWEVESAAAIESKPEEAMKLAVSAAR